MLKAARPHLARAESTEWEGAGAGFLAGRLNTHSGADQHTCLRTISGLSADFAQEIGDH
jgi:hypothetical protein